MLGLQPVTISGAFVFGLVLALLGSLKLALAKRLALGEARIGGLLSALNLALIPMMLLSGILIDLWSVRVVLILGSLVTGLALASLAMELTYSRTLLAVLLVGLGTAALSTSTMVLMPAAFFERSPPQAVNLGCVFIALGALITPALVDVLLGTLGFRRAVIFLGLLCAVPAVLAMFTSFQEIYDREKQRADLNHLLGQSSLWLAGLVFLFYAPLEGAIGIWTTTFLTEMGTSERKAAWLLSGFWAAFLGSRLLIAILPLSHHWTPWLLIIPALLTAVLLGNLAGTADPATARYGLLALGFLLGPIFPTLVGVVFEMFRNEQGTAYGAMYALGSAGSLILAPLIGARALQRNVQAAFRIPMVLAGLLTVMTLVFILTKK